VSVARSQHSDGARILVLADRIPRPGLRVAEHRLLQLFAELAIARPKPHVTLVVADWCARTSARDVVEELGVETVSHVPDWGAWFQREQADLVVVHGARAHRRFGALLDVARLDVPRIIDSSALDTFDMSAPLAPLEGDAIGRDLVIEAARAHDAHLLAGATAVLCASEHEAELVRGLSSEVATAVLRSHVSVRANRLPRSVRHGLVALGSFVEGPGSPDEDAVLFLAREVLPRVRRDVDVDLHIVGEDATPAVRSLSDGARFHVARGDVAPALRGAVGVVSLRRFGRGLTAAPFAAFEAATPVLAGAAVSKWNDGPGSSPPDDNADALASAITALVRDDAVWGEMSSATSEWTATHQRERYREALNDVLSTTGVVASIDGESIVDGRARTIPWQGRAHGRWAPDPGCRVAPNLARLDLELADQVTTDGAPDPEAPQDFAIEPLYDEWIRQREPTPRQRWDREARASALPYRPLVSIVMVERDVEPGVLSASLASLEAQVYSRWELCLVDDASTSLETLGAIARAASADARVRLLRRDESNGLAGASDAALGRARGDFVAFVPPGGVLEPLALLEVVDLINRCPELDVVYTDEHEYDASIRRCRHPALKPSWSPDLLRSTNYMGQLTVLRRSLVDRIGGPRDGFDGAVGYDLALRATDVSDRVGHVAIPLYRSNVTASDVLGPRPDRAFVDAGRRALSESVERSGESATVEDVNRRGDYRVRYAVIDEPVVGVVIPTRDRHDLLDAAVRSIRERSTYRNVEITIVDNASTDPDTLAYLERHDGPVLRYTAPFNYARMMNLAVAETHADLVLFVNNDVEVFQPNWIEAMLEHAQRPSIGAVGARLWYPEGIPQHQGIFIGGSGRAHNADFVRTFTSGDDRHQIMQRGRMVANFAAVTGACLMARPSVLTEVGGFEERLHVAFNDVDLCLKIRARGYDIVCTPFATLVHYESATRGSLHPMENDDWFGTRWGIGADYQDPYSNPNYDQQRRFALRLPS
jgi:GT2 family glycosyltransferase